MLGSRVSSINDESTFANSCWLKKPSENPALQKFVSPRKRSDLETSRETRGETKQLHG